MKSKILIVEDEVAIADTLLFALTSEGFAAQRVALAGEALARLRTGGIDLVILDVGLPDMDGREAVKLLRKGGYKAPIIMLTAHDTDSDTILGLEAGANDYVTKPFRFAVLLARIE